jgi:hypothetical protein
MLLAGAISPDNTPHGYNLTFAFPMLMFIIIAGALYLRFRSTHRVPGHVELTSSRWAAARPDTIPAAGETTPGSTLHEGNSEEAPEAPSTEDSE